MERARITRSMAQAQEEKMLKVFGLYDIRSLGVSGECGSGVRGFRGPLCRRVLEGGPLCGCVRACELFLVSGEDEKQEVVETKGKARGKGKKGSVVLGRPTQKPPKKRHTLLTNVGNQQRATQAAKGQVSWCGSFDGRPPKWLRCFFRVHPTRGTYSKARHTLLAPNDQKRHQQRGGKGAKGTPLGLSSPPPLFYTGKHCESGWHTSR